METTIAPLYLTIMVNPNYSLGNCLQGFFPSAGAWLGVPQLEWLSLSPSKSLISYQLSVTSYQSSIEPLFAATAVTVFPIINRNTLLGFIGMVNLAENREEIGKIIVSIEWGAGSLSIFN